MRIATAAMLAASLLVLAGCSKPTWKTYDYPAWGFGVSFQTPPTVTETQASATTPHSIQAEAVQDNVHLVVLAMDSQVSGKTDQQLLADLPDEVVQSANGTYKSATNISLGKVPGREILVDRGQDPPERARIFVVNGRVYQVITQTPEGEDDTPATKFLQSFHLLGQKS
ncbi:MAG TPA: hypothetical protein VKT30_07980 [Caulobacteraceae bacterium]|nr:hypothetical protein [Caulobacteraceae bacterium]